MKRYVFILTILFLLVVPTGAVLAAPHDRVLEAGDEHKGDLTLFGDRFTIEEGAEVTGDVIVFGGNTTIAGDVDGDLVLFGGNVELASSANVDGDCILIGGNVTNETEITCHVVAGNDDFELAANISEFDFPQPTYGDGHGGIGMVFGSIFGSLFGALFLGFIAFIIASVIPDNLGRVQDAFKTKPVVSGTVGALTFFAVPSLIAILVPISMILILACFIGLLGFPIMIAMALGLAGAMFVGWIAAGSMFGDWLAQRMNWKGFSIPFTVALGTAVLTFIANMLGEIPFIGGLPGMLISFMGIGAVALTKFGTQQYPQLSTDAMTIDADKEDFVLGTLPDDE